MKKQIAILVVIVVVCFGLLFLIVQFSKKSADGTPRTNDTSEFPVLGNQTNQAIPTGKTFVIPTDDGDVVVKNFFRTGEPLKGEESGVLMEETSDYAILFYTKQKEVLITLKSKPVISAKQKAEEALLRLLGTTKEDACKLFFSVRTTIYVDPDLAGKELGLSFCK